MATELPDGTIVFEDRADAGRILAGELTRFRENSPFVLALPRGGVVVGYEVALRLVAPLDVIVARKLGAPGREELGIGAIAPDGVQVLDQELVDWIGVTPAELSNTIARETAEMERRLRIYRGDRPLPDVRDRTVILVDDGLATGVTARAAVMWLRRQLPRQIVLAVPVCAPDTADRFRSEGVEVVCASSPLDFRAVGIWYRHFDQVSDREVVDLMQRSAKEAHAAN